MYTNLLNFWYKIRESFWLVPGVMVALMVLVSFGVVWIDVSLQQQGVLLKEDFWMFRVDPDGARTLLSTIATSMIGVAGVTFSITMVVLTLASSQFGPRLLRGFMKNIGNQVALGTFIATFIYSLLVLRVVRTGGNPFVPNFAVNLAVLLTFASVGVLIFFFHHVANQIQAETLIGSVVKDFKNSINRLFPKPDKEKNHAKKETKCSLPPDFNEKAMPVKALHSKYIQAIDYDGLLETAKKNNLILKLTHRAGDFVSKDATLLLIYAPEPVKKNVRLELAKKYTLGARSTMTQDIEFVIDQLVEIAVRALSPGINDPFTAIQCIDGLTTGLCVLAKRPFPSPYRCDDKGELRLFRDQVTFAGILDSSFNQIRQNSAAMVSVRIRLLEAISRVAADACRCEDKKELWRHASMIKNGSQREGIFETADLKDISERYNLIRRVLEGDADPAVES